MSEKSEKDKLFMAGMREYFPQLLIKSSVSFLNSKGGAVYIGVNKEEKRMVVEGITVS